MAKEKYELIALDDWEDEWFDPVNTSVEHDNAGGDADDFEW